MTILQDGGQEAEEGTTVAIREKRCRCGRWTKTGDLCSVTISIAIAACHKPNRQGAVTASL